MFIGQDGADRAHIVPRHKLGLDTLSHAESGRQAGDAAGRDFRVHHPVIGTRDPSIFFFGLVRALAEAGRQMVDDGSKIAEVVKWSLAFNEAFAAHLLEWERERFDVARAA